MAQITAPVTLQSEQVDSDTGKSRLGSFLLGGLVGGLAGIAASRLRIVRSEGQPKQQPGLAAFEAAPCYQELLERDSESPERPVPGG
jgi:hypothetical protein